MHHYALSLSGLNCMGCARKLERQLHSEFTLHIHSLSPTFIELDVDTSLDNLLRCIESLGYQATLSQSLTKEEASITTPTTVGDSAKEPIPLEPTSATISTYLLIEGMTCASCVASVEKALTALPGVNKVQVNLAEQSALVLSQQPLTEQLLIAVKQAGYQAQSVDDPLEQQAKQQQQLTMMQRLHQRNAMIGLVLGGPMMLWGMAGGSMMIDNRYDQLGWGLIGVACLAMLATAGRVFFVNAWQALLHRRATMDSLVALGTGAAWFYSMLVVVFPEWFPAAARHVYFEASAMIIGLISLGHYIETKAKSRTTQSLQALINLQPQQAILVTDQGEQVIALAKIQQGMMLRIKPGAKIPVDGVVIDGDSYIDEAMLTGEPIPAHKIPGNTVSAGTINQDGSLLIEATGIGSQTMLARIIQMVRQAQSSKPAIAKLADRISAVFVPIVVVIACIAAAIWFWFGPDPKASYMLVVATTVLIIACPCALGLATPLSVTVGIGKAAEMGILIRDANVLQLASNIDTVVFDKTGTLTQGKPSVQHVVSFEDDESALLSLAFGLEQYSEHPLAKAICEYAQQYSGTAANIAQFENQRGKGVQASYQGDTVHLGSLSYMQELAIDLSVAQSTIQYFADQAWTPVAIARHHQLIGMIAIADPIKASAAKAVKALQQMGIHTVMLTGDQYSVAESIAKQLGIDQVIAQVLPEQKAQHIEQLQHQGRHVAMVGDGINDAPALAQANIGIAMGSGSDVAIESAQMTLLNSSPLAVVNAINLSKATLRNMQQNLFGAFIYNTLGIPIAAGILYPAFGFLLSPVVAGAAMALSSITVVTNANRLRFSKVRYHD